MAQVLHGSARTTEKTRKEIQKSKESIAKLAKKYNINPKTVQKWKRRKYVHDSPMGPKNPHSTVLSKEEEAAIVAFRQKTLLPLDDCLYALQEAIPHLTRSSLHRCLVRHDISRLPKENVDKRKTKKFEEYTGGYIHIDITQMRTEEGKQYLFVAIDRSNKFAYAEFYQDQTRETTAQFLTNAIAIFPYKVQVILTDNGAQFTNRKQDTKAKQTPFDRICEEHGIEHRLTKPYHPWTNGQVERMNRTLKEATIKKYHYKTDEQLKKHLAHFLHVYNFAKRLKALKGLTPYEQIENYWKSNPEVFKREPTPHNMGLYR